MGQSKARSVQNKAKNSTKLLNSEGKLVPFSLPTQSFYHKSFCCYKKFA